MEIQEIKSCLNKRKKELFFRNTISKKKLKINFEKPDETKMDLKKKLKINCLSLFS